ncbi:hypothetical protein Pmar_PMAR028134 [Perkinsus marinus ATCC 50983]|uniref:Uncharacterized protein n=1 Tax=Perkinsus marinus (strain ATCC 50983 / TXsc) TaxID=423536 RepID=C5LB22_PERM5|nr:hypothetical protein Pmar_PMAR028134 [Perkinsus marinus ATCC 50983]EER05950.1 hypothetical protein Pmar_PMAR028134 [Perkinsus marinus ATCC 50983]|eukprot:XP_002774134.1 hypothetical protein Pmar_PMAR028134 [Perkinsus marinus ATCC 50983]
MELQAKIYTEFMSGRLLRERLKKFELVKKNNIFDMKTVCPDSGLPSRVVYWRRLVDLLDGNDHQINLRHWRLCTEIHNNVGPTGLDNFVRFFPGHP